MQLQGNNDHSFFFKLGAAPHFYGFVFYLGR